MTLRDWVHDADFEFQCQRPRLLADGFPGYLRSWIESRARARPELGFPLLAQVAKSDLELALQMGESRQAADYLREFPELAAVDTVATALRRIEIAARSPGDFLQACRYAAQLPAAERAPLLTSGVSPRFQLQSRLGGGGEGEVWLAYDCELDRLVAVKVPKQQDADGLARAIKEARITARLQHPAIVSVFGVAILPEGDLCCAMERVELDSLTAAIKRHHQSPPPERLDSLRRLVQHLVAVARAIAYAHGQGFLHRDLKPANILVGDFGQTMVLDWGLSLARTAPPEVSNAEGTLPYMSPEVAECGLGSARPADERTDVYGLGACLFEILTGRPPFAFGMDPHSRTLPLAAADFTRFLERVAHEEPQSVTAIAPRTDRTLTAICRKALKRAPVARYGSATQLADDLDRWLADAETSVMPFSGWEKVRRHLAQRFTLYASALGILLALGVAFRAWRIWDADRTQQQQIEQLLHVGPASLPAALDAAAAPTWRTSSLLHRRLQQAERSPQRSGPAVRRLQLALLRHEPQLWAGLVESLARLDDPAEWRAFAVELEHHTTAAVRRDQSASRARLAELVRSPATSDSTRLRAAALLASFWANSAELESESVSKLLAEALVRVAPQWVELCGARLGAAPGIRTTLAARLRKIASDEMRLESDRIWAASAEAQLVRADPAALLDLLAAAQAEQLPPIIATVVQEQARLQPPLRQRAAAALAAWRDCDSSAAPADIHSQRDSLSAAAANLNLALWRLSGEPPPPELFANAPDPRLRTELIERMRPAGFSASFVVQFQQSIADPGFRAALLQAWATFRPEETPPAVREALAEQLLTARAEATTPELVATLEYLLDQLGLPLETLAKRNPGPRNVEWLVGTAHETAPDHRLVVVSPEVTTNPILLGAHPGEGHADADSPLTPVSLKHSYAIGCREVTRGQLMEFLAKYEQELARAEDRSPPGFREEWGQLSQDRRRAEAGQPVAWDDKQPAVNVPLAMALTYCNWLSVREQLEPCYQLNAHDLAPPLPGIPAPAPNFAHSGYRLPTATEWEIACRANSVCPRPYGFRGAYLPYYAHFRNPRQFGPIRSGALRPNAWGLSDMLGNAAEWCHRLPASSAEAPEVELRGGSHLNITSVLRSGYRLPIKDWNGMYVEAGFRIVKKIAPTLAAEIKKAN